MAFTVFILLLIIQRLSELFISAANEKKLRARGGVEYGREHYPFMVTMHTMFIISLIAEYIWRGNNAFSFPFAAALVILVAFKYYVIAVLGENWTTRIIRVPGSAPVTAGPFRYFRHPNYTEVVLEIAVMPLMFNLYYTAVVFSILNAAMLYVRIKAEDRAWILA
ncbi:MAG: isoprenylcysteine carboxylmethyltransferase family protein [Bacteroidota bacterium]